jgi:hypothetical protein
MQFGLLDEESRKPIKESVKKVVYKRANKSCECCGFPLPIRKHGEFHHWRKPTISPTDKTVQFLCRNCHTIYGHKRKVVRHSNILGDEIEYVTIRKKVPRLKKITRRKTTSGKKPTSKRKTTKKKPTKRKTTTKKKTPKRKTTTKRKTAKRKTTRKKPVRKRKTTKKTTKRKTTRRKKK